ncbi:MAG: TRAP transporter small permease [Ignavibacteria bacterium]|nr:TRAP transporter small permease [Ignavibacteria bacterium]
MKIIKTLSSGVSFIERMLLVLLFSVMVVLAFLQVVMRNVFSTGFLWADPLLRHMVLWIGLLGASLATQGEKHINLDIITRYTSARVTNLLRIVTNLFAGIITFFLAHAGYNFLQNEIATNDVLFTIGHVNYQAWWFQLIIPIGFGLMAFRFAIRTIEHCIESFRPFEPSRPPVNVPTIEI